ncbi:MAG TPA: hypothetical protein VFJ53_00130 [Solirubrobacterales bacterium]|nr:hypothetical protein [Solirubrobacterales bacterium]
MTTHAVMVIADAIYAFESKWDRLRRLRVKRRLTARIGRCQGLKPRSFTYLPSARERLVHLTEFRTGTTGRDEDRPGRLLLGRFPESGLSVA